MFRTCQHFNYSGYETKNKLINRLIGNLPFKLLKVYLNCSFMVFVQCWKWRSNGEIIGGTNKQKRNLGHKWIKVDR